MWKWFSGALLGLALVCFLAFKARELVVVNRAAKAVRAALASGRYKKAAEPLAQWLRASPASAEAHALAAQLALEEGDLGKVTQELSSARSLGYPHAELERLHAVSLSRIGRYAEAEPILVRLFQANRGPDPAVAQALARVYLMTYRLGEAEEAIRKWSQDAPADGRPFLWLTEIDRRMEVDSSEPLERHYKEALRRDPDLDPARLGLAETLRRMHRNTDATALYETYLARHPDDPAALVGAGRNAMELGDLVAARRFLDRAAKIDPRALYVLKGQAALDTALGNFTAALDGLSSALRIDPFDTESLYSRSRVRSRLGDHGGARQDLEAFRRCERDHAELLKLRGSLMSHPDNNDLRSKVAAWMFAHGRAEDGLGWANAVLASDPRHKAANLLIADYYRQHPDKAGLANYYRLRASEAQASPH